LRQERYSLIIPHLQAIDNKETAGQQGPLTGSSCHGTSSSELLSKMNSPSAVIDETEQRETERDRERQIECQREERGGGDLTESVAFFGEGDPFKS
jgi:hypothetical protein